MLEKVLKIPGVWTILSSYMVIRVLVRNYRKASKEYPNATFSETFHKANKDTESDIMKTLRKVELNHWKNKEWK